ncbi:MAG: acylphosphatase [Planctomycetota bacterium]|nr:acylphosphatase [Planctomycetota bacterium]
MVAVAHRVVVHGRVQGVAFRHHTKVTARELGVVGWVRNLTDGTVEVWIEGEEGAVLALTEWLKRGPPAATVSTLHVEAVGPAGHVQFKVRFE